MLGKSTRAIIWPAKVIVDHFSDVVYAHLMRSTSQEETLAVKPVLKWWEAMFGFQIKRHHENNDRLSEQPFRDAVEEAN